VVTEPPTAFAFEVPTSLGMGRSRKGSSFRAGAATGTVLGGTAAVAAVPVPVAGVEDDDDEPEAVAGVVVAGVAFGTDFVGVFAAVPFLEDDGFVLAGSAAPRDSMPLLQPRTNQTRTLFIPVYLGSPLPYFNPKTPLSPPWQR
jgi:hypothetical protein